MGRPVEKKRKKKGRPSLLDLQKRSLRLQKQEEQQQQQKRNPNPSFNPYARFHNPPAVRLAHRSRNPDPVPPSPEDDVDDASLAASLEDDEDEDEPAERRKEKKLKLVLHLPHPDANSSDAACFASESDGATTNKRKIDAVRKHTESKNSSRKATEAPQGGASDLGPTTSLPDKKLLEFILDRLQKKDTYGVFSEPVDPVELPDYHGIIQHPMDFGTVRKRLLSGSYRNLEHFENDVFLISSNAMRYNAPDTIYFRQARSIHELAKKSFANLRQESDDNNPEPKIVRRGRPPGTGKNNINRPVARPLTERAGSEFSSEVSLANTSNGNISSVPVNDLLRGGLGSHKPVVVDLSAWRTHCFQSSDSNILSGEHKLERSEDYPGTVLNGSSKSGKKLSAKDENFRDINKHCQLSSMPALTAPAGDRKTLVPVGLHMEFAYARSLARFAANIGPIGWRLAAKRIEKALPPGTKFGPGWVGESEFPLPSYKPHSSSTPPSSAASGDDPSSTSAAAFDRFVYANEAKDSFQLRRIAQSQPPANGFKAPFSPNLYQTKFTASNVSQSSFGL